MVVGDDDSTLAVGHIAAGDVAAAVGNTLDAVSVLENTLIVELIRHTR